MMLNRPSGDNMDDIDTHSLTWEYFMTSSMRAFIFLGEDYSAIQGHSEENPVDPSLQDSVLVPNNFFEFIYHVD